MIAQLHKSQINQNALVNITGSKSESNRLLILQGLYPAISINNISNADDTKLMALALKAIDETIDIHHAGTAMRFLTAYFAIQPNRQVVLTGSERMQERPIKVLVDALKQLGADIDYVNKEGFPPLKINGKVLDTYKVSIRANVSSQYISALILIGSKLAEDFEIHLEGQVTSVPYIKMTLSLLNFIGIDTNFEGNVIKICKPKNENLKPQTLTVESDWSAASYYYSIVALSPVGTKITLSSFKKNSLQGDSGLVHIYKEFGVETKFNDHDITLIKKIEDQGQKKFNLIDTPDLAQTIAVTCFGLAVECDLKGLHTLKIKETDRLEALKTELEKFGASVTITEDSLRLRPTKSVTENVKVDTYNDHRMAMAFAPLCVKYAFKIMDAGVVSKSYPEFWQHLQSIGVKIQFQNN